MELLEEQARQGRWESLACRAAQGLEPLKGRGIETLGVTFGAADGAVGLVYLIVEGRLGPSTASGFEERFLSLCSEAMPTKALAVTRFQGLPLDVTTKAVSEAVRVAVVVASNGADSSHGNQVTHAIEFVQRETASAVLQVTEHAKALSALAQTQAHQLRAIAKPSATEADAGPSPVSQTIEALDERLERVTHDLVERVNKQAKSLERARQWTHDIVRLGQSIAQIASSARMLTFNARIESARIGDAGKGFAVIAQSIQDLATQIRETNNAVGALATNLARSLPELGVEAEAMAADAKEQLTALAQSLKNVHEQQLIIDDGLQGSLHKSIDCAVQLERQADRIIGLLQFEDVSRQKLEEAKHHARDLQRAFGLERAPADAKSSKPDQAMDENSQSAIAPGGIAEGRVAQNGTLHV
jgi:hypothetical protein